MWLSNNASCLLVDAPHRKPPTNYWYGQPIIIKSRKPNYYVYNHSLLHRRYLPPLRSHRQINKPQPRPRHTSLLRVVITSDENQVSSSNLLAEIDTDSGPPIFEVYTTFLLSIQHGRLFILCVPIHKEGLIWGPPRGMEVYRVRGFRDAEEVGLLNCHVDVESFNTMSGVYHCSGPRGPDGRFEAGPSICTRSLVHQTAQVNSCRASWATVKECFIDDHELRNRMSAPIYGALYRSWPVP